MITLQYLIAVVVRLFFWGKNFRCYGLIWWWYGRRIWSIGDQTNSRIKRQNFYEVMIFFKRVSMLRIHEKILTVFFSRKIDKKMKFLLTSLRYLHFFDASRSLFFSKVLRNFSTSEHEWQTVRLSKATRAWLVSSRRTL